MKQLSYTTHTTPIIVTYQTLNDVALIFNVHIHNCIQLVLCYDREYSLISITIWNLDNYLPPSFCTNHHHSSFQNQFIDLKLILEQIDRIEKLLLVSYHSQISIGRFYI